MSLHVLRQAPPVNSLHLVFAVVKTGGNQCDQIGRFFANLANRDFLEEVPKEVGNSFGYFFTIISGLL